MKKISFISKFRKFVRRFLFKDRKEVVFLLILCLIPAYIYYDFYTTSSKSQIPLKNNRIWLITQTREIDGISLSNTIIWKQFMWNTEKSYNKCKEWAKENEESDAFWNTRCGLWCTKYTLTWWRYYDVWYMCEDEVSIKGNNMGCLMDLELWYNDSIQCQTFDNFDYCKKYWCN